jgi:hypothetical protein
VRARSSEITPSNATSLNSNQTFHVIPIGTKKTTPVREWPTGNYPETSFWEARQIGTDKSSSRHQSHN